MKKNVADQTKFLIEAVQDSGEYCHYQELLKKVMQDSFLYGKINELRKKSWALQLEEENDFLEANRTIFKEYEEIMTNPVVNDFLIAEQTLCNMIRNIHHEILECVNLDIGFLEE